MLLINVQIVSPLLYSFNTPALDGSIQSEDAASNAHTRVLQEVVGQRRYVSLEVDDNER